MSRPPLFGRPEPGESYWRRPGVYGLLQRSDGRIAVVDVDGKWFLPGGGIEADEEPEPALVREFVEETGLAVAVDELLWEADEYTWATAEGHFVKAGRYHRVRLVPGVATVEAVEEDHELRWVTPAEARIGLYHEAQRVLVQRHAHQ